MIRIIFVIICIVLIVASIWTKNRLDDPSPVISFDVYNSIVSVIDPNTMETYCQGYRIDPYTVLTAHHCFRSDMRLQLDDQVLLRSGSRTIADDILAVSISTDSKFEDTKFSQVSYQSWDVSVVTKAKGILEIVTIQAYRRGNLIYAQLVVQWWWSGSPVFDHRWNLIGIVSRTDYADHQTIVSVIR